MAEEKKAEAKVRRPQALKRDLQSKRRRQRNRVRVSNVKTAIREFDAAITKGDKAEAATNLKKVYSLLDKGVKTGTYKLNTASRTKSRLTQRLA